jgi:hypothetical protein
MLIRPLKRFNSCHFPCPCEPFLPRFVFDNLKHIAGTHQWSQQQRINEIAQMLSGDNITDAAITNAKELLTHK